MKVQEFLRIEYFREGDDDCKIVGVLVELKFNDLPDDAEKSSRFQWYLIDLVQKKRFTLSFVEENVEGKQKIKKLSEEKNGFLVSIIKDIESGLSFVAIEKEGKKENFNFKQ